MMKCAAVLGLILLPLGMRAQRVVSYPYDLTDATVVTPTSTETGIALRIVRPEVLRDFLCGAYEGVGYTLHVFPDETVMLSESCDICPTTLLGEGKWTARESGISIEWSWRWFSSPRMEEYFLQQFGSCRKLTLLLGFKPQMKTMAGVRLVSDDLRGKFLEAFQARYNGPRTAFAPGVAAPLHDPAFASFTRLVEYRDWGKVRDDLKAARTEQR